MLHVPCLDSLGLHSLACSQYPDTLSCFCYQLVQVVTKSRSLTPPRTPEAIHHTPKIAITLPSAAYKACPQPAIRDSRNYLYWIRRACLLRPVDRRPGSFLTARKLKFSTRLLSSSRIPPSSSLTTLLQRASTLLRDQQSARYFCTTSVALSLTGYLAIVHGLSYYYVSQPNSAAYIILHCPGPGLAWPQLFF